MNFTGATPYTYTGTFNTDTRILQTGASASVRIASVYYASSSFTVDVNLTDGQTHQIALYCLDLDTTTRSQTISILNANTQHPTPNTLCPHETT